MFGGKSDLSDPDSWFALNAASFTVTPTWDGSGQTVEPWVLETPGWSHAYAMGVTPYPGGDSSYENPTLLVSNDGDTWVACAGGLNPLWVPTPELDPAHTFWPDPSLVFDEATGRLHYFWQGHWYAYTDDEGVTVSAPTQIMATTGELSPSFMYEDGVWKCWAIWKGSPASDPNTCIYRTAPSPTGPWSAPVTCTMPIPAGRDLWHISVHKAFGLYFALVVDTIEASAGGGSRLYLGISSDGLTWRMGRSPILGPRAGSWDSGQIYRASMVEIAGQLHVWYSAASSVWHTGRTVLKRR